MRRRQSLAPFLLLSVALVCHVQAQGAISCTAGHYRPGETATITCHFHGQVSTEQNTGVYITRYRLGDEDDSGKEVLMCHFSGGSVSVCNPEPGYRFINFNKNNLTIEVPDVASEFQGRYSCGVVPADSRKVHPCLLVVKEPAAPDVPYKPKNSEREENLHTRVETTHGLVIFILILMIVAAAVVIYALVAHQKNWFPFSLFRKEAPAPNQDKEKGEMLPEPDPSGAVTVAYKPVTQESGEDEIRYVNEKRPLPEHSPSEKQPMLLPPRNHPGNAGIEEKPGERKIETEKERKARLKKEDQERKAELAEYLRKARSKEEKNQIKKEYEENETEVKLKRKEEETRWKEEVKKEEQRLKAEKAEKERLKKEKKAKGKGKG